MSAIVRQTTSSLSILPLQTSHTDTIGANWIPLYALQGQQQPFMDNNSVLQSTIVSQGINHYVFDAHIERAVERYRRLNKGGILDLSPFKPFLDALRAMLYDPKTLQGIAVYDDGATVRCIYDGREFVVDYDLEDPEIAVITTYKEDVLVINDCSLPQLSGALERF
ncbi:hypothetical protein FACS1894103_5580 [Campylobacterota bacterium]|nr:hypothetical protein FACS1894103_5580 [Campylobacterota bacterium]